MKKNARIFVAGAKGLVGSAITRKLQANNHNHLLLPDHATLDLTVQSDVNTFFAQHRPEYVFLAAAKVGGIHANNTYRGDFIYDNLCIQNNVIHAAKNYGVTRLLFLGSSCIYPRQCPQPMREEYLLTGALETTNEPYAIAKIAGIKLCEAYNAQYGTQFISVMPTNLYGPHDNFNLETAHVLPALLRKAHEAKLANEPILKIWGSGHPLREFLYVEDMAEACIFLMNHEYPEPIVNLGSGEEISICALAERICTTVGYHGSLSFDATKPDGTPRKLLDCTRLTHLGWKASTSLTTGLTRTYDWFKKHLDEIKN